MYIERVCSSFVLLDNAEDCIERPAGGKQIDMLKVINLDGSGNKSENKV